MLQCDEQRAYLRRETKGGVTKGEETQGKGRAKQRVKV
jgi:hypothetical protein